jgi:TPP-dependent pyruvate/acetoin dehydrogenase alpha subunit
LIEAGWATAAELKATEKDLRAFVDEETAKARSGCVSSALPTLACCHHSMLNRFPRSFPEEKELYTDIYWKETPKFIRGVDIATSVKA